MKPLHKERNGVCSASWLFMGEMGGPCDKSCEMCYYAHQKNLVFYDLPTMIRDANLFRHYYGIKATDITGGEPTLYKWIVELVRHCAQIGLSPRIITHGQNLRDDFRVENGVPLYKRIEEAGLELWRVSIHGGTAESHDKVLGSAGSFDKLVANLDNLSKPVQFNTTLLDSNYKDLPVNIIKDRPPTVYNIIYFLPYFFWSSQTGPTEADFQVQYVESAPYVADAINTLEALGWEVNVRYWPLCIAKEYGFEANVSGYHQVPFDPWEWRLNATARSSMDAIEKLGGWYEAERQLALQSMAPRNNEICNECSHRNICDKPPEQYQKKYGIKELQPMNGELIVDPLIYQKTRKVLS